MPRHFAEIDSGGVVQRVIVADSEDWIKEHLGGDWMEVYNPNEPPKGDELAVDSKVLTRRNYPGPGHIYDKNRDAFIPPKPYDSWELDETSVTYKAPVDFPRDGKLYTWNEPRQRWDEVKP